MKSTHNTIRAYGKSAITTTLIVAGTVLLMAACSTRTAPPPPTFNQNGLVESMRVPMGHVVAYETTATGTLNYECRSSSPTASTMGWTLVSPSATLYDRQGRTVGAYSGPPATWTMSDGSSVTGTQLAVSPVLGGIHIPLQLSTAAPSTMPGVLRNVTHIQRVNTKNGQDFVSACTQGTLGQKVSRPYQADYIFWKAA